MIAENGRRVLGTGRWVGLLASMVLAVYYLSLRYVFPGYFQPFAPHHVDSYLLVTQGVDARMSLSQLLWRPRPIGWLFVDLFSSMGLTPMIVAFSAVGLAAIGLLVFAVEPLTARRNIRWVLIALYLVNVFCQPGFYINYNYDFFHALSCVFLACLLALWHREKGSSSAWTQTVLMLLTALIVLTKETTFIAIVLFWCSQVAFERGRRRQALAMLTATLVLIGLGVLHGKYSASPWLGSGNDGKHPYYVNLNPKSLWETYRFYFDKAVNRYSAILVFVAVLTAAFTRARWKEALVFVAMGLALFVPHAMLPNHKLHYYIALIAPFGFLPLLLVDTSRVEVLVGGWLGSPRMGRVAAVAVVGLLSTLTFLNIERGNHASYRTMAWHVKQELINQRLMKSLPQVARMLDRPSKILVLGLDCPFHPFASERFIDAYFGQGMSHEWTIVDHRGKHHEVEENILPDERLGVSRPGKVVRWIDPRTLELAFTDFDLILLYGPDGRLLRSAGRAELRTIQAITSRVSIKTMVKPAFFDWNAKLSERTITDWRCLYEAGLALKGEVDDPALAESFLARAAELSGKDSPLPLDESSAPDSSQSRPLEAVEAGIRTRIGSESGPIWPTIVR